MIYSAPLFKSEKEIVSFFESYFVGSSTFDKKKSCTVSYGNKSYTNLTYNGMKKGFIDGYSANEDLLILFKPHHCLSLNIKEKLNLPKVPHILSLTIKPGEKNTSKLYAMIHGIKQPIHLANLKNKELDSLKKNVSRSDLGLAKHL